ncbi:MAG: PadR family transcriptional regulator [Acutalibacteraceae bacterium]
MSGEKSSSTVTENMKKAVTEMMLLALLNKQDMHIFEILEKLETYSQGAYKISYPYAAIYRLIDNGYICENGKKIDCGRRRQFFHITDKGRQYYFSMKSDYDLLIKGINNIFSVIE